MVFAQKDISKRGAAIVGIMAIIIVLSSIGVYSLSNEDDGGKNSNPNNNGNPDENYNFGVCVVAHGMPGDWNEQVRRFVDKVDLPVPLELGFLEYSPHQTVDDAIEKLNEQGVNRIIAIPIFINGNTSHTEEIYEALDEAETDSAIFCTTALNNHVYLVETLTDYGLMLCDGSYTDPDNYWSGDPADATLVFIGHGDNEANIQSWIELADAIKGEIENKSLFKEVIPTFMGDGNLRGAVQSAAGYPLVVQWFICWSEYSEMEIRKEIVGEDCDYLKKGLIDHYNLVRWVEEQYYDYPDNVVWVDMNED